MIKKDNPDIDDEKIAYARQAMIDHGLVESGQALTDGIGAMSADQWSAILSQFADAGAYDKDLKVSAAYDLRFVNKKVGM